MLSRTAIVWICGLSLLFALCGAGLSQIPDPAVLGITSEPSRILFYGGSGVLALLAGLTAALTGIYLGVTKSCVLTPRTRHIVDVVLLSVAAFAAFTAMWRFIPR